MTIITNFLKSDRMFPYEPRSMPFSSPPLFLYLISFLNSCFIFFCLPLRRHYSILSPRYYQRLSKLEIVVNQLKTKIFGSRCDFIDHVNLVTLCFSNTSSKCNFRFYRVVNRLNLDLQLLPRSLHSETSLIYQQYIYVSHVYVLQYFSKSKIRAVRSVADMRCNRRIFDGSLDERSQQGTRVPWHSLEKRTEAHALQYPNDPVVSFQCT